MAAKAQSIEKASDTCPVYVVYGKDRRRTSDSCQQITEKLLEGADPQLALSSYEGDGIALSTVLDDLRTLPFLAQRRVVVLKQADNFISDHRSQLEQYLLAPSATGVLVLVPQSFPANTRLAKLVKKIGKIIVCEPVKGRELPEYLIRYTSQKHHVQLSRPAAQVLIDLAGEDVGMLLSEIDKLVTYLADPQAPKQQIDPDDVQALVGHNRQYNVFNVIDAMTQGNTASALSTLEQMLSQDRDAQYRAVGAFAWHFRRLYNARLMIERRVPEREIVKILRLWSRSNEFMKQVKQLKTRDIAVILRELMNVDLASKTGRATVREGLEKLITRSCSSVNRVA